MPELRLINEPFWRILGTMRRDENLLCKVFLEMLLTFSVPYLLSLSQSFPVSLLNLLLLCVIEHLRVVSAPTQIDKFTCESGGRESQCRKMGVLDWCDREREIEREGSKGGRDAAIALIIQLLRRQRRGFFSRPSCELIKAPALEILHTKDLDELERSGSWVRCVHYVGSCLSACQSWPA